MITENTAVDWQSQTDSVFEAVITQRGAAEGGGQCTLQNIVPATANRFPVKRPEFGLPRQLQSAGLSSHKPTDSGSTWH
jgi:hypothetical protein